MRNRASKTLRLIAFIYCGFPVIYPLWMSLWFAIPGGRVISIFFSLFYWIVMLFSCLAGFGLWRMKRWSWYLFLAVNLVIVYLTAYTAVNYGESDRNALAFLLSVIGIFLMLYRVGREVRVPYFLPNIRWWESDPAKKLLIPALVMIGSRDIEGDIVDLAPSGCFIKCADDIRLNEKVGIRFTLFGYTIDAIGTIVWCAQSTVTHPKGVGVLFDGLTRLQRRRLRVGLQKVRRLTVFTDISQPLPGKDLPEATEQATGHAK